MRYQTTTAYKKIAALRKRIRIIQGGSSAGKTIADLLLLIDIAQSAPHKTISVVSETLPHLKRGAIRDFLSIMQGHGYFKKEMWNKTDFVYTFETGSIIEFFSAENSDKVRGPRRDILFENEANNISYSTHTQLAIRTNDFILLDYNPVEEFWVDTELKPHFEHDFLILTYKDNEALSPNIVQELESRKYDSEFYNVYVLGKTGVRAERIYKGWRILDEIPKDAKLISRGLDFGYTNDPAVVVDIWYCDGEYIFDEQVYETGLLNKPLSDRIKKLKHPKTLIIADSAEPKSIAELQGYDLPIIASTKGKGSVSQRIAFVQQQRCATTKRSTNIIKEYRKWSFIVDKDGKVTNEPRDFENHAMDAIGYGMQVKMPSDKKSYDQRPYESPFEGGYLSDEIQAPGWDPIEPRAADTPIALKKNSYQQPDYESPSTFSE